MAGSRSDCPILTRHINHTLQLQAHEHNTWQRTQRAMVIRK